MYVVELTCVPVRPNESPYHTYDQKNAQMLRQTRCNISNHNARLSTICEGCTSDVRGIVFVVNLQPESDVGRFFIKLALQNFSMLRELK